MPSRIYPVLMKSTWTIRWRMKRAVEGVICGVLFVNDVLSRNADPSMIIHPDALTKIPYLRQTGQASTNR